MTNEEWTIKVNHKFGMIFDRYRARLTSWGNQGIDSNSEGETQRVALGRALSIRPRFLCLDEPFSALDEDNLEEICQLFIQTIKMENVTTLHITHSKSEATRLGDVIFTLSAGKVQSRSNQATH